MMKQVKQIVLDGLRFFHQQLLKDVPNASDTSHALSIKGAYDLCARTIVVDMGTISALPVTKQVPGVTTDMIYLRAELSNPSAQTSDWIVDTNTANKVTIRGSISGSTGLELVLGTPIRVTAV